MTGVFVSHAHADEPLVRELAKLFEVLFGGKISPLNYSSRKDTSGGGIDPGEDWFGWIVEQVSNADFVFIVLTPNSALKPWVIWEAGAAAGAAMSGKDEERRPLFPIVYGMSGAEVPGPFERLQLVKGDEKQGIELLIDEIFNRIQSQFTAKEAVDFGSLREKAIDRYVGKVVEVLPSLPIPVTEPALQEWIDRLDELRHARRQTETKVLERWIDVAFGRGESAKDPPLDLRVHRRLAELYISAGKNSSVDAERQFELARKIAPRDILILRGLGKVKLDRNDLEGCAFILSQIYLLDPEAFTKNPENAALKARYLLAKGDETRAISVLEEAFNCTPQSYYVGDLLGQYLIEAGRIADAKSVFARVSKQVKEVASQSIWNAASLLTASLITGNEANLTEALNALAAFNPDQGARDSINGGLLRVVSKAEPSQSHRDLLQDAGWL